MKRKGIIDLHDIGYVSKGGFGDSDKKPHFSYKNGERDIKHK